MRQYNVGCSMVKDGSNGQYSLEECLSILRQYHKLGVRHIEYSHPQTTTEEEAQTLRRYARQLGLILWSAHATCYRESTREASMAQLQHDAKIAALLDATVLVFHPTELLPDGLSSLRLLPVPTAWSHQCICCSV